ncbi:hypothetical protein [Mycobacterium deserti]|uniref:Uncharacterized protein n=1 Tax=Mycobacterium deserti TaxID=2978347 RepID=A0ABT2MF97_9MYCO|nr:hypothetical protein [Mycobacterium deserti]MCT7660942.1 hypothetical protein [Mycobacterium deserti]
MTIRGPLITLGAVAALGGAILSLNVAQEPGTASPTPVAETSTTAAPTPAQPLETFPQHADYVGDIPTADGTLTVEISVDGSEASAYACDGYAIESWLRGPAVNGTMRLANTDRSSRLDGRLENATLVGTLWIGERKWDFTAARLKGEGDV